MCENLRPIWHAIIVLDNFDGKVEIEHEGIYVFESEHLAEMRARNWAVYLTVNEIPVTQPTAYALARAWEYEFRTYTDEERLSAYEMAKKQMRQ
jgi:hypothetical protein